MKVHLNYSQYKGFKVIQIKTKTDPKKRANLRLIYSCLCEIKSDLEEKMQDVDYFIVTWATLAKYSGVSKKTLQRYTHFLAEYGLINMNDKEPENPDNQVITLSEWQDESRFREGVKLYHEMEKDRIEMEKFL